MTWTKWLLLGGLGGLTLTAGMSVLMAPANPVSRKERLHLPPDLETTLRRSCFDCHSNETRWPWYSKVWPVSVLIESDVEHGRRAMNFSEWPPEESPREARRASGLLMASCAALQEGLMPKPRYLAIHADARVPVAEKSRFCEWTAREAARLRAVAEVR
jgi:hypothetical protein